MPIITASDLYTNIYSEIIEEITRTDSSITDSAIGAAISETKMYLSRYDLVQLFGSDDAPPAVTDEFLKSIVKDIACWHLLRISNSGIDYATARTAYQDAITSLKNIMTGQAQPENWPYADTSATPPPPGGNTISWDSNPKRSNYY
jgi:hypothetical protein